MIPIPAPCPRCGAAPRLKLADRFDNSRDERMYSATLICGPSNDPHLATGRASAWGFEIAKADAVKRWNLKARQP